MENKKNKHADLRRSRSLFFHIGLVVSLSLVLLAFEWKSYGDGNIIGLGPIYDIPEESIIIPPTIQPPPPPPKIQQPEIIEVPDEEEIEEEVKIDLDTEITEETNIQDIEIQDIEEDQFNEDDTFIFVEHQPSFEGGYSAFYKFISKKLKYPPQARRMGIEGKVFINFVIAKDGSVTNVKLTRGIGGGCDEEAIRVLQKSPKWSPGKQRGIPVKVQMTLPITFKLN